MSLLMEALRKAEEAKRKMQEAQAAAEGSQQALPAARDRSGLQKPAGRYSLVAREPGIPAGISETVVPGEAAGRVSGENDQNATSLDEVLDYLATAPAAEDADLAVIEARRLAALKQTAQQRSAASVFKAKQSQDRSMMPVLLSLLALLLPVGAGLYWYLGQPLDTLGLNPALANYDLSNRSLNQPATTEQLSVADGQLPIAAPAEPIEVPAESAEASPDPQEQLTEASAAVAAGSPQARVVQPLSEPAPPVPMPPAQPTIEQATSETPPANGIEFPDQEHSGTLLFARSSGSREPDARLVAAYEQLQSGNNVVAVQLYREILESQPNNRDGLLGLAAAHVRAGDKAQARGLFARLLQLDPQDPIARTGLLETLQDVDPQSYELELKNLQSSFPQLAPLSFALGNFYAGRARWSEAQGAYYSALLQASRADAGPVNPDYAFNLAVSLEQLQQPRAALDYYRQASNLARAVSPGFDPELLQRRLAYLEQNQP